MRRTFTALLIGAVSLAAGLVPAGALTGSPTRSRGHLRLECHAERDGDRPVVACNWSPAGGAGVAGYRLWRGGDGQRRVVYRGKETSAVDAKVRRGRTYIYKVQALDTRKRVIAASEAVKVAVPPQRSVPPARPEPKPTGEPRPVADPKPFPRPEPMPEPRPEPKPEPRPETRSEPLPEPRSEPMPDPKPEPLPEPMPETRPEALPEPKPAPQPRPAEVLKLACRVMEESTRPTPAVACRWSPSSRPDVAGYQLWRAERNTEKKVVFRSRTETFFVDPEVMGGHTYAYGVQALDAGGRVIGASEIVRVEVPGEPPASGTDPVEPVRMEPAYTRDAA